MSLIRKHKNLYKIKKTIDKGVTLVVVSKNKSILNILEAYNNGHRIFGENKVQELVKKAESLPKDINWHMIGHLQSNKVKFIAPFISLIHTVDSFKLLKEINKRAYQNNRIIDCLLQVHIATEKSKFGFNIDEIDNILERSNIFKNIKIKGLMGMASFTENKIQIKQEFKTLEKIFSRIKKEKQIILSMGMSNDYEIAIQEGSNMIRIGSAIFGKRN